MSKLNNIIARAESRLAPATSRIEALLESLTPRDRNLLIGLVTAATITIVASGGWLMKSTLSGLESNLAEGNNTLAFIQSEATEYEAAQSRVEEIESELRKHQETDFSTFIEQAAKSAKIDDRLKSVREISVTTLGTLEQKNYSVDVSRLTLSEFTDFLYEVEGRSYPLRIQSTDIKITKVAGTRLLNVKLDIAAFRLPEEDAG